MVRQKQVRLAVLGAISEDNPDCDFNFFTYKDLIHGYEECDLGLIEIQFDITDKDAISPDLFGFSGTESIALVPVQDQQLMAKLYEAQIKFNPRIIWNYFPEDGPFYFHPIFPMPGSSAEYAEDWIGYGVLRAELLQLYIARMLAFEEAGYDIEVSSPYVSWPNRADEPHRRIAEIMNKGTKFRPVIMVHHCDRILLTEKFVFE